MDYRVRKTWAKGQIDTVFNTEDQERARERADRAEERVQQEVLHCTVHDMAGQGRYSEGGPRVDAGDGHQATYAAL